MPSGWRSCCGRRIAVPVDSSQYQSTAGLLCCCRCILTRHKHTRLTAMYLASGSALEFPVAWHAASTPGCVLSTADGRTRDGLVADVRLVSLQSIRSGCCAHHSEHSSALLGRGTQAREPAGRWRTHDGQWGRTGTCVSLKAVALLLPW